MTWEGRKAFYCECGDHAWVPMSRGFVTLVSPDHGPLLEIWTWHTNASRGSYYASRTHRIRHDDGVRKMEIKLHQVVCPAPDGLSIDHANRNGLDNRMSNLRIGTFGQNCANRRKKTRSGYRGVKPQTTGRLAWRAVFRRASLGTFDTPEEAARAYDKAAFAHWGIFATLNFPDDYRKA